MVFILPPLDKLVIECVEPSKETVFLIKSFKFELVSFLFSPMLLNLSVFECYKTTVKVHEVSGVINIFMYKYII